MKIETIKNIVADYFGMNIQEIVKKTNKREIVQARQISMYFCKKYTKEHDKTIGLHHGNKDRTSVYYSVKTIKNLISCNKEIRKYCSEISSKLINNENKLSSEIGVKFADRININGILL